MSIPAGFSERIFEFAFNAEFVSKNKAILAACPNIPTQQQEKQLAHDVEFKLKKADGAVTSLFFQHKVARCVSQKSGSNGARFHACGGPYYAFELDVGQYNRIYELRAKTKQEIYYCAPLFVGWSELNNHYSAQSVCSGSVKLDIAKGGKIFGSGSHSIIVSLNGARAFRCSEEPIEIAASSGNSSSPEGPRFKERFSALEARTLYEDIYDVVVRGGQLREGDADVEQEIVGRNIPKRRTIGGREDAISAIAELARDYLGLSWLLVTAE